MRKWIATITNSDWGLEEQQEFTGSPDAIEAFYQLAWIKPYDDTKPRPPMGVNEYESGMVYPNKCFVFKDNAIWKPNVGDGNYTSNTWVPSEWVLVLQGA